MSRSSRRGPVRRVSSRSRRAAPPRRRGTRRGGAGGGQGGGPAPGRGPGPARFFGRKAGAPDAAVLNEQAALLAQESGLRQLYSFTKGDEFVEVQGSIVLQDSLMESDPAFVQKFTRATLKGLLYLRDNRAGSVAIHSRLLKVDAATANRLYDLARPGTTGDGTVSEEGQKKSIAKI